MKPSREVDMEELMAEAEAKRDELREDGVADGLQA